MTTKDITELEAELLEKVDFFEQEFESYDNIDHIGPYENFSSTLRGICRCSNRRTAEAADWLKEQIADGKVLARGYQAEGVVDEDDGRSLVDRSRVSISREATVLDPGSFQKLSNPAMESHVTLNHTRDVMRLIALRIVSRSGDGFIPPLPENR